jgi:hypothetical protein
MNIWRATAASFALAILSVQPMTAQDRRDHSRPGQSPVSSGQTASPYAGMERRVVKTLSDQQTADLRAGRGMALALAAELNGYPGPMHVLELADALRLTDNQRTRTDALFQAMKAETIPIGEQVIAEETALDDLFGEKRVTPRSLAATTSRIGTLQGDLRAAHLRYHLAMMDVLSSSQIIRYIELRGYASGGHRGHTAQ